MQVTTDHRIIERGDDKMILGHFDNLTAYVTADRQSPNGAWTVSAVDTNVPGSSEDATVSTRHEAVDTMCDMATHVLPEDGHSIFVPNVVLSDGSIVGLRDKP